MNSEVTRNTNMKATVAPTYFAASKYGNKNGIFFLIIIKKYTKNGNSIANTTIAHAVTSSSSDVSAEFMIKRIVIRKAR